MTIDTAPPVAACHLEASRPRGRGQRQRRHRLRIAAECRLVPCRTRHLCAPAWHRLRSIVGGAMGTRAGAGTAPEGVSPRAGAFTATGWTCGTVIRFPQTSSLRCQMFRSSAAGGITMPGEGRQKQVCLQLTSVRSNL